MKPDIRISREFGNLIPEFRAVAIYGCVKNSLQNNLLWKEIDEMSVWLRECLKLEDVNKQEAIQATRTAYKILGKDPNRYRPSAEALCRRIVRNMDLYRINTLVDLINLVSMRTGYSIGGFDADKIEGNLELGVGAAGEIFHGIGRGPLNIEGLPVYRDRLGGIGTPTSDEERTKLSPDSSRILIIINAFTAHGGLEIAKDYMIGLLKKYTEATELEIRMIGKE